MQMCSDSDNLQSFYLEVEKGGAHSHLSEPSYQCRDGDFLLAAIDENDFVS